MSRPTSRPTSQLRVVLGILVLSLNAAGCSVLCHITGSCSSDECSNSPTSPSCAGTSDTIHTGSKQLAIAPVAQQTLEWCWLASAEMVFKHYNVPSVNGISYQCGIMGTLTGPNSVCFYNCSACVFGSGSDANSAAALRQYPSILQQYFFPLTRIPQVSATLSERRLTMSEVQTEIDAGHPIELGITPSGPFLGQAAHDVVLTGYSSTDGKNLSITINDPAPYDFLLGALQNPYRQLGANVPQPFQYQIPFSSATRLQWSASITTSSF